LIIQHYQFKNALMVLAEKLSRESPNTHFILASAILRPQNWELKLDAIMPENSGDKETAPAYFIGFDELSADDVSIETAFIKIDNFDKALEIADNFVRQREDISKADLHILRNYSPIWEIIYIGENHSGAGLLISLQVDTEENIVTSSDIDSPAL
jgi:hypothetical protein